MNKNDIAYAYYSKVLNKPFDTVEELKDAEKTYFAVIEAEKTAKESVARELELDKARLAKAFKERNQAHADYNENMLKLVRLYHEDLTKLKESFESDKARVQNSLENADSMYSTTVKEFMKKHPGGFSIETVGDETKVTLNKKAKPDPSEVITNFSNLTKFFEL